MEPVIVRPGSDVVTVLLNRPEKRNALSVEMSNALRRSLDQLTETPLPVVLRSSTPGMFVAGTDVAELKRRSVGESLSRLNGQLAQHVYDHPWPTVAVVDGAALGGGCELALACDFRISTVEAQWGLPEVRLGLVPSAGGLTRLSRLVGFGAASDLVMTGRRVRGDEAGALGLVHRVTTAERLDETLAELLTELSRAEPRAVRLAKEAMRVEGDRHRLVDATAQALCLSTEETQRRLQALLDGARA